MIWSWRAALLKHSALSRGPSALSNYWSPRVREVFFSGGKMPILGSKQTEYDVLMPFESKVVFIACRTKTCSIQETQDSLEDLEHDFCEVLHDERICDGASGSDSTVRSWVQPLA